VIEIAPEVAAAVAAGRPVVVLESTIFSRLGLPAEAGEEALRRCLAAVRQKGAVPALTAVLDGALRVGLGEGERARVLELETKLAERDLPAAAAAGASGATTVSAALALAARAGIEVFATGGIGGVHRRAERTGDVSSDLTALARHAVVTVSAGVKGFLDLPRTLEALETLGVPVLGYGTDELPAFWCRTSGLPVPYRCDSAGEVAAVARAARELGLAAGVLVAVPCPEAEALPRELVEPAIEEALGEAERRGISGGAVTPFVLERLAEATGGRTLPANLALAERNAEVAAAIAVALAEVGR
jgi:pseudouridine-5'-phosphate glycosidase